MTLTPEEEARRLNEILDLVQDTNRRVEEGFQARIAELIQGIQTVGELENRVGNLERDIAALARRKGIDSDEAVTALSERLKIPLDIRDDLNTHKGDTERRLGVLEEAPKGFFVKRERPILVVLMFLSVLVVVLLLVVVFRPTSSQQAVVETRAVPAIQASADPKVVARLDALEQAVQAKQKLIDDLQAQLEALKKNPPLGNTGRVTTSREGSATEVNTLRHDFDAALVEIQQHYDEVITELQRRIKALEDVPPAKVIITPPR